MIPLLERLVALAEPSPLTRGKEGMIALRWRTGCGG